jgi:hypothetical protein
MCYESGIKNLSDCPSCRKLFCEEECSTLVDVAYYCKDCYLLLKICLGCSERISVDCVGVEKDYCPDCHYLIELKRKEALIEKLEFNGLSLRNDSKLCKKYIVTGNPDIDHVVRRMGEMKFLYECCDMQNELDTTSAEHLEELEAGFIPDMSVFNDTEDRILTKINGYPDFFPWQLAIRDKAARKIQEYCHNWLWKPICKDGTMGINLRLGLTMCKLSRKN